MCVGCKSSGIKVSHITQVLLDMHKYNIYTVSKTGNDEVMKSSILKLIPTKATNRLRQV